MPENKLWLRFLLHLSALSEDVGVIKAVYLRINRVDEGDQIAFNTIIKGEIIESFDQRMSKDEII